MVSLFAIDLMFAVGAVAYCLVCVLVCLSFELCPFRLVAMLLGFRGCLSIVCFVVIAVYIFWWLVVCGDLIGLGLD